LRGDMRKRTDSDAMQVAKIGPTKQRSLNCKSRRRPSISESAPTPGRSTVSWRPAAAHGEMGVLGRGDLKRQDPALEFEAHVGADASALEVEA